MTASSVFWLTACLVLAAGVGARPGLPSTSPKPDAGTHTVPAMHDASSEMYLRGSSPDENLDDVISLDGGMENLVTPLRSETDSVVSNDTLGDSISEYSDFIPSDSSGDTSEIHLLKSDLDRPPSNESGDPLPSNDESQSLATLLNETDIFVSSADESVEPSFTKSLKANYTESESQNASQSQNLSMVYILSFGEQEDPALSQEDTQDYLVMDEKMKESDSEDMGASQDTSGDSLSAQVPESQISFFDHTKGGIPTDGASENLVALFWAPENMLSTHISRERSVSLNAFPEASSSPHNALQNPVTPQNLPGNQIPSQNAPDDYKPPQIIPVNQVQFLNDQDDHIPSQILPEFPIQTHDILSGHVLSHSISGGISSSNVQINAPSHDEPANQEQGNAADVTVQNLSDHGFSHGAFQDNTSHTVHINEPSHNAQVDIVLNAPEIDTLNHNKQVLDSPSHISADAISHINLGNNPSHSIHVSAPLNTVGISVSSHAVHADVPSHNTPVDITSHTPQTDILFHENQVADAPSHINPDVTSYSTQDVSLQSNLVNVPSQITNIDAPLLITQSGVLSHNAQPNILSHDSVDVISITQVDVPSQSTRVDGPHAAQVNINSQDTPSDVTFHAAQTDFHSQNVPVNVPSHLTPVHGDLPSQSASVDRAPVHSISNVNIPIQSVAPDHNLPHRFSDHDIFQHSFSELGVPSHNSPVSQAPSADFSKHVPSILNPEHLSLVKTPGGLTHTESFPQEREHSNTDDFPSNSINEHHDPSPKILIDQFASENVPLHQVPLRGHQIQSASFPVNQGTSHIASIDSPEIISGRLVPQQSDPLDQANSHGFIESHALSSDVEEYHASSVNSPSDFVTSFEPQRFPPNALGDALESHIHTSVGRSDTASLSPHRSDTVTHVPSSPTLSHSSLLHTNEQNPRHPSQSVNIVIPEHHNPNHGSVEGNVFLDSASKPTVPQNQPHEGISSIQESLKPIPISSIHSEEIPSHQSLSHSFPSRITYHKPQTEPRQNQHFQSDHPQNIQVHQASARRSSFGSNSSPAVPHTTALDDEDDPKEERQPAEYTFTYVAQDEDTGRNFGHEETRQGHRTQGSYYVSLPDGRVRKVSYYVEPNSGFVARLSYEGDVSYDRKNVEEREHRRGSQSVEQDYPSVPEQPPDVASYQ
ncbi:uncharacterized protein LOC125026849 [Penaeus chinensis]|uniref:uncharacterized protein LOC125026849 n=1 Tax=Penaeus chinensis TaxID=139456 RepID=UPI001FB8423D|nr:uncharacterized protein LOC125026849 [Penaeus chinensis]